MSGAYGWGGKDRRSNRSSTPSSRPSPSSNDGFTRAKQAHQRPAPAATPSGTSARPKTVLGQGSVAADRSAAAASAPKVTFSLEPTKKLKSTARNVLAVVLDMTGSMGDWRDQIMKYLPMLYKEAQGYLGDDLEILFIVFGDLKCHSDKILVAEFGRGPELDSHLVALNKHQAGGGDEEESPEMVAYYLLQQVDLSSAKNVYTFFITDEKAAEEISETIARSHLGLQVNPELCRTTDVFGSLLRKTEVFVILRKTEVRGYSPEGIRQFWVDTVGEERVMPLDLPNLVVEAMLACVAKTTGQYGQFTQDFQSRRGGTKFGAVNLDAIGKSVAMVPGAGPDAPTIQAATKLLVPIDGDDDDGDDS